MSDNNRQEQKVIPVSAKAIPLETVNIDLNQKKVEI